jgi:hypothetical protein
MKYILEIETNTCINIFFYEKSSVGLNDAFLRVESFFCLRPESKATIVEDSTGDLVWSSEIFPL